jgi:phosphatidylserine decarboxylase
MTMVKDAYRFVVPALLLCLLFAFLRFPLIALFFLAAAAFIGYFFRNPRRSIPGGRNLILSPADGKVVRISHAAGEAMTVSIFLSIFDVHVNRAPIMGQVESLEYKRGRFKAAYDDEASLVNEQNVITIKGEGIQLVVRQIAGLIARRVICWKKPGDSVQRGELIGLIRFGSRVDVVLPKNVKVLVRVGDRVRGGSTILGEYA